MDKFGPVDEEPDVRLIGSLTVDSGQLMIVDPCYLDKWGAEGFDYSEACEVSFSGGGTIGHSPWSEHAGIGTEDGLGRAIVSMTWIGDGVYPVFGEYDPGDLRPIRIIIDLFPFGPVDEEGA